MNTTTPDTILATVKGLRARVRALNSVQRQSAHCQIAKRRIADAVLFAERNTEYAEKCCYEARFHLNHLT
jgi:hypothetical protein